MRYSRLTDTHPEANSFVLEGGRETALLIHGFTGTPAEMKPIGSALHAHLGWSIHAPLLPGHGTNFTDLAQAKTHDWLGFLTELVTDLSRNYETIHLIGFSMGASLALQLFKATPHLYASAAFLAPAIWLRPTLARWALHYLASSSLQQLALTIPKIKRAHPNHVAYHGYPLSALAAFERVCATSRQLKKGPTPPYFVSYATHENTVHPKSAQFIWNCCDQVNRQCLALEETCHILPLSSSGPYLIQSMLDFYQTTICPFSAQ